MPWITMPLAPFVLASYRERRAQAPTHIFWREPPILIGVKGVKHCIAAQPLFARDTAIAVKIVEEKNLMDGMGESGLPFQACQAMGQLHFQGFNGF
jgi:hypothetical protein